MNTMGKEGKRQRPGRLLIWSGLFALLFVMTLAGQAEAQTTLGSLKGSSSQQALASDTSCSKESPYGFTTITVDQNLVERYQELGVCWVRYQIHENDLLQADGSYNWSKLDQAVALMDEAGIFMDVPLQCFSGPGSSCFGSNPYIPTVKEMTSYASEIATRYNGENGHGTIEAFEIGNEEYDQNTATTIGEYADLLEAGYSAIKQEHPSALVGMYGPYKISLSRLEEVMTGLADVRFDFANVHYYGQGEDPGVSRPDHPSYRQVVEAIEEWLPDKPIWVTEIGWATSCTNVKNCKPVTEETQVEYLQEVMTASEEVGVAKVFWFTLNYGNLGYSLYPNNGKKVAAYDTFAQIVGEKPLWGNAGGQDGEGGGSDSGGSDSGGGNTLDPTCETVMEQNTGNLLITTTCSWTEQWLGEEEVTISCSLASEQETPDQSSKKSQTCKKKDLERICLDAAKAGFELAVCTNLTIEEATTEETTATKASTTVVAYRPGASSDFSSEPVLLPA